MSTRIVKKEGQRKTARTTLILVGVILFVALGANGLAYLFLRHPAAAQPQGPATATAPARPATPGDDGDDGMARAHRAAGIAALEHRDYDRAVTELTQALRLRKDKGDLVELLNIANELRTRDKGKPSSPAPTPAPSPPPPEPVASSPSRSSSKSKPARVATRETRESRESREKPAEPTPAAPEPVRNGLLLVTSTPPGLVVTVDGKAVDLTPTRVPVRPGSHRVTLAQGERRVFDESVEVAEDSVKPITWEAKPEPLPAAVAAAKPEPPPAPAAKPDPPPVATKPSETAAAVRPASGSASGDLEVTSPSLYGEIWINDHPYGFPPVTARGLPAGKARVEVRVQGAVKRKMTVEVAPGISTPVRVR